MSTIIERLALLRKEMKAAGLSAYIIPSSDAHLSEYTPDRFKSRAWISGFNGSAGTVVVTLDKAGLWTDSRYFLQAGEQLKDSSIELFKMGVPGVPTIEGFLASELPAVQSSVLMAHASPSLKPMTLSVSSLSTVSSIVSRRILSSVFGQIVPLSPIIHSSFIPRNTQAQVPRNASRQSVASSVPRVPMLRSSR